MAVGSKEDKRNKRLGRRGEAKAVRYLKRSGYKICEHGYVSPFGEVDIIARRGDVFAFIEVKTRLSDAFGTPSEAVNERKKSRYIQAANFYFVGQQVDFTVRFDIIEIYKRKINHIENAFYC